MTHTTISREPTALRRIVGAIVFIVAGSAIATAAWLSPDPSGHGTHEQLGLAPCSMMMFSGKPCPACGYTTAFSHVVHGQFVQAVIVQPAGTLVALAVIFAGLIGAYVAATGSDVANRFRPLAQPRYLLIVGLIIGIGWVYKMLTTA